MTTAAATPPSTRRASRDRLLADLSVVEPTPEQRRRAALAVCRFNTDPAEAREMLDALGLLDDDAIRSALPVAS